MTYRTLRALCAVATAALAAFAATDASAGIVYSGSGTSAGGNAISAQADVSFSSNTMTITLWNTTAETFCPAELLAGFDFALSGGLNVLGLVSASTPHGREVFGSGVGGFTDTAGAVNLLTAAGGSPTWELDKVGAAFRLLFNPDAEYAIIGAAVDGAYAEANGGIVNNKGHNPFSALQATFTLALSGVATDSNFKSGVFLFNTANFTVLTASPSLRTGTESVESVPLPSTAWAGLAMLSALGVGYALRKRRSASSL